MMKLEQLIRNYLNTGTNRNNDPEKNQQILVANLFGFIGYTLTLIMGLAAVIRQDNLLATVLLIASTLFFTSRLILVNKRLKNAYRVSGSLVTISLMLLMVYLIYAGGVHGTGPLWIYIVPPVALFFGGLRKGTRSIGLFILAISFMLFYPNNALLAASYSFEFKSRLLYSFLTVSLLFAFYEYSRQKSYKQSLQISRKFENQARVDLLSGLLNRRGMSEVLEAEFSRAIRHKKELSLIMCDIDHFKIINDQSGHQIGDQVIEQIAQTFKTALRQHDNVARWGGEEYLFLLPETNEQQAFIIAEKLRTTIAEKHFYDNGRPFNVTVSMGVYQVNQSDSINHAITLADKGLYLAKNSGRNRSVIHVEQSV
ncbi:MAG: diguanylate cyclase [Paraglaciecola sp.]|nr:diguanylate cyclase [Paraglaciecola sp.]